MHMHTETFSIWQSRNSQPSFAPGDAAAECDLCGRPARRETAFERVHHRDDEVEIALVCRECELGTD
jgi:hypothetical protein